MYIIVFNQQNSIYKSKEEQVLHRLMSYYHSTSDIQMELEEPHRWCNGERARLECGRS